MVRRIIFAVIAISLVVAGFILASRVPFAFLGCTCIACFFLGEVLEPLLEEEE
jgi:hypothetical protein